MDNGSPFGSIGPGGLSKLTVWWISLGIDIAAVHRGSDPLLHFSGHTNITDANQAVTVTQPLTGGPRFYWLKVLVQ